MVFDDSGARNDWGWKHDYDIDHLVEFMLDYLTPLYESKKAVQQWNLWSFIVVPATTRGFM